MTEPKTIRTITETWLTENGYTGLCDSTIECGCIVGDLMPCADVGTTTCEPGHKVIQVTGDWLVFPGKEAPINTKTSAKASAPYTGDKEIGE